MYPYIDAIEEIGLFVVTQGDWNAKVGLRGPDAREQWPGTVGRFGVGETSERGERKLKFDTGTK